MIWQVGLLARLAVLAGTPADSAVLQPAVPIQVVRTLDSVTVVGDRLSDPRSTETVHPLSSRAIRLLAVDRFVDVVGLQAGVVVSGEDLHVRGGRTGELVTSIAGVPLNEPRRGVPMEVPLLAVRSADLLTGGLDADHAGSLAGELDLETEQPTAAPVALIRWTNGLQRGTGYAVHARASTPLGTSGLGVVTAGEARLDELGMPGTRSRGTSDLLGMKFGWRQDNHLLAWAKLAPVARPQRGSIEVLGSRVVRQPYDPMFDFDGWVSFEPDSEGRGEFYTGRPLGTADRRLDDTYFRYRAGDHRTMSEERRLAVIATLALGHANASQRLAMGWSRNSGLKSVGLRRDPSYINALNRPVFGPADYAWADPFHAYWGDEPYFRRSGSQTWFARLDAVRRIARRHLVRLGAGFQYENVRLYEIDQAAPVILGVDSLRTYNAFAPGVFAYAQHHWEFGGHSWNAGLRVSSFTAGPQAKGAPYLLPFQRTNERYHAPTRWSWSPRLGFTYPVSERDIFSVSYSRIFQDPPRDLLYDNRTFLYDRHPYGNGTMIPAEVISYQAALKHILDPRWSLQCAAFYRDFSSQPGTRVTSPRLGYNVLQYESADNGHASGVELTLAREERGRGRFELSYTYMSAWGTQSNLEGLAYGLSRGYRPAPLSAHPLDWDERHAIAASMLTEPFGWLSLSWSTRVASGLPWTPLYGDPSSSSEYPPAYTDQMALNSARLPWNENTNMALRCTPGFLGRFTLMLSVTNLFANKADRLATLSGYPNPIINTLYDEYGAYRTQTGRGGGAYWNDPDGDGVRQWIPVGDRRLAAPPRVVRLGLELGW
ncbi:MAG: TonB-dependent receptor [Candidatus Eisenbacteria bacterium]|nr:TonB-dependent receptor [Candidatus Eisenbacteria bacterium]